VRACAGDAGATPIRRSGGRLDHQGQERRTCFRGRRLDGFAGRALGDSARARSTSRR